VFQSEKALKDLEEKISESDKTELTELINSLKESVDKKELTILDSKMETLNSKFQSVSQSLYENSNNETTNESPNETDFSDVEFEEVK
jgi:molecular chaperone DnaK